MSRRVEQKKAARVVRDQLARERRRQRALWTSVAAVVALVLAGMIGWAVYQTQRGGEYTAPPGAVADDSGIPIGDGPVTVDLYADFLCPACRQFEQQVGPTLDQLVEDGRITLVYHPVAILDRLSDDAYSTRASAASGCAAAGGQFEEYAAALYEQQPAEGGPGLSEEQLITVGGEVGLDTGSFGQCVRDDTYGGWPAHVTEQAGRAGVSGTPTVMVDGETVASSAQAITAAVDAAG
ncbi:MULTISPECIES: thioredoxin domain-containing protein [unclassified Solwaraspora]|uniref:DsbA family protein n=1 Tax=unclassified Solwaraspora TaxID=2627926 RepID=UPI00248BF807|nr:MULTISPECIES: thioredoxin domain-containing protein [unclassified Solwaraspora]WBB98222.1 thioredoxin domain-containing protein [Solwaraspora sp. WMMA2059]WBC23224.1 thioredoxin domain-containing protein [Solwaraspora sp. WMMA2080]WJK34701.1 thioredoxin domain-containing protein [Solwaraspora sp. WMMA2065]